MSKLIGNQEFSGYTFIKGVGTYDGTNASGGTNDVATVLNSGGGGGIQGSGVTAIVALTQSEYDALSGKSSTTLYIVTPDTNVGGAGTNYLKLSGANFSNAQSGSGTITEVGSGFDTSDLTNNPPVIYDSNGQDVALNATSSWTNSTTYVVTGSRTLTFHFNNGTTPTTYTYERQSGGGSPK